MSKIDVDQTQRFLESLILNASPNVKNFTSLSLSLDSRNLPDLCTTHQIKVKLVKKEKIFHTISITFEQYLLQVRANSKKCNRFQHI